MYVSKVLKRKDAASLSIAIVMGLAFTNFLAIVSSRPAEWLSGTKGRAGYVNGSANFKQFFLYPLMLLIVELVLLELSVRLIVWLRPLVVRKKR